jgi:hypothetical protein
MLPRLLVWVVGCVAVHAGTHAGSSEPEHLDWTPKITSWSGVDLFRRQAAPANICGYVSGDKGRFLEPLKSPPSSIYEDLADRLT